MARTFRWCALIEALTWAGLLIGMYVKYVLAVSDLGVWWFGRLHGVAFITYVVITVLAAARLRWPWWAWLIAIVAAVPPLVTLPVEILFRRWGLLDEERSAISP